MCVTGAHESLIPRESGWPKPEVQAAVVSLMGAEDRPQVLCNSSWHFQMLSPSSPAPLNITLLGLLACLFLKQDFSVELWLS